ncbi:MAG: hypothetical protein JRD47_01770 [Deltaproteobacteria bacterium]|nr:hypothetical protein [Deltaproteobacteria bacterium]
MLVRSIVYWVVDEMSRDVEELSVALDLRAWNSCDILTLISLLPRCTQFSLILSRRNPHDQYEVNCAIGDRTEGIQWHDG